MLEMQGRHPAAEKQVGRRKNDGRLASNQYVIAARVVEGS
jgi:hypothetical protein